VNLKITFLERFYFYQFISFFHRVHVRKNRKIRFSTTSFFFIRYLVSDYFKNRFISNILDAVKIPYYCIILNLHTNTPTGTFELLNTFRDGGAHRRNIFQGRFNALLFLKKKFTQMTFLTTAQISAFFLCKIK